jgi:triacylglycerol lipase
MSATARVLLPSTDFVPDAAARREEARSYRGMIGVLGRPVALPRPALAVPVVLVPGFISGDVSMTILSRHLRRHGHRTFRSAIGANLGCTDAMVDRLVTRLEAVVAAEGRPVALVGHSRGGMIVKLVGRRRPDLVAGIVVLSAPVTGALSVAPHVRKQLEVLFGLNRRGVRGVISEDCVTGECAARIAAEFEGPFPDVPYTSVYSRRDAIIDWRTCLDPAAELIEVRAAHSGMSTDPVVMRIVADRLGRLSRSWRAAGYRSFL